MGNTAPCDLDKWIPKNGGGYDIIAIGVQESTYEGAHTNVLSEMKRLLLSVFVDLESVGNEGGGNIVAGF